MTVWEEFFERDELRWKDPYELVVVFSALLKEKGARRVLDLGCGVGRHLVYLANEGFETYGLDISGYALEQARRWLEQERLAARLAKSDMARLPCRGKFFDAAICVHVIQHQTFEGIRETVGEIRRVLRSGGLALVTFPTRRDSRYGRGKEIEPNTFLAEEGPDAGVPHHYSSLAEIEELFDGFAIRQVRLEERLVEPDHKYSHWNVLAEFDGN